MVYVDEPAWPWKGKMWAHMIADTHDELHEFAKKLGLKRVWFQKKSSTPHYDITENKRKQAIRMGATAATRREFVDVIQRLREEKKAKNG